MKLKVEVEPCRCPICEGVVTKEARDHVLKEVSKLALDPDYKPKIFGEETEDE